MKKRLSGRYELCHFPLDKLTAIVGSRKAFTLLPLGQFGGFTCYVRPLR